MSNFFPTIRSAIFYCTICRSDKLEKIVCCKLCESTLITDYLCIACYSAAKMLHKKEYHTSVELV